MLACMQNLLNLETWMIQRSTFLCELYFLTILLSMQKHINFFRDILQRTTQGNGLTEILGSSHIIELYTLNRFHSLGDHIFIYVNNVMKLYEILLLCFPSNRFTILIQIIWLIPSYPPKCANRVHPYKNFKQYQRRSSVQRTCNAPMFVLL